MKCPTCTRNIRFRCGRVSGFRAAVRTPAAPALSPSVSLGTAPARSGRFYVMICVARSCYMLRSACCVQLVRKLPVVLVRGWYLFAPTWFSLSLSLSPSLSLSLSLSLELRMRVRSALCASVGSVWAWSTPLTSGQRPLRWISVVYWTPVPLGVPAGNGGEQHRKQPNNMLLIRNFP